jgi:hypothetical protein
MTCRASAVKPLDESRGAFVGRARRRWPARGALSYTWPSECDRLTNVYEEAKVPPLRIVSNGALPERSTPTLHELQPNLGAAAFEKGSRASGESSAPTAAELTFGLIPLADPGWGACADRHGWARQVLRSVRQPLP